MIRIVEGVSFPRPVNTLFQFTRCTFQDGILSLTRTGQDIPETFAIIKACKSCLNDLDDSRGCKGSLYPDRDPKR